MISRRLVLTVGALFLAAACGSDGDGGPTDPPGGGGGTVQGTVTGPGGPVPGAEVEITGGANTTTNGDGEFSFANVSAGQKTLTITPPADFVLASGQTAAKSATVTAGGTVSVTWSLQLANTAPKTVEVGLNAASFSPRDVVIPVGSTVNWVNQTAITHTISPNDPSKAGTWADQNISGQGTEFDHTFATAGTFDYVCKLHSGMSGVIRVH